MAKKVNTTMIGDFVVIACILLAASVVILGSGKLFKRTESFVLYFDSSIQGLSVGAPVLIQGVQVGLVTSISIHAGHKNLSMNIPVYIEIEPDKFHVKRNGLSERSPSETIAVLAERGLRAVLSMQSIATGKLMIELDYYPHTPLKFKNLDPDYPEIPTISSTTERIYQVFQDIDFVGLANHAKNAMVGVDDLVNSADITVGVRFFRQTADSGGIQKQADIALAMALDPEILIFDEPSAGLDPVSARRLDDMIIELRDSLGTTMVVVTHEFASIFSIGNNSVFLDVSKRTMTATGNPNELFNETVDPTLYTFLT